MKYVTYTPGSFPKVRKRKCSLKFSRKSGKIVFSADAAAVLELEKGDAVVFLQDQKIPFDWFVRKTEKEDAFKVTVAANGIRSIGSKGLAEKLADILKVGDDTTFTIMLGSQMNEDGAWPLITAPFVAHEDRPKL